MHNCPTMVRGYQGWGGHQTVSLLNETRSHINKTQRRMIVRQGSIEQRSTWSLLLRQPVRSPSFSVHSPGWFRVPLPLHKPQESVSLCFVLKQRRPAAAIAVTSHTHQHHQLKLKAPQPVSAAKRTSYAYKAS